MSYTAIYRRFRPKRFKDIIGQENIKNILLNQIKNNNIAHGYVFSGIRGTGKTSVAKIFARSLNCFNPIEGEPCNECESCKLSLEERHMDLIEIDAASNNKVEDIREINESTNYPPTMGKYKVYIIDEVHMLSKGAFNAFLKTLEEPPSYVVFLLATTEENKIPATILSRCQRYEFKPINNKDIIFNLLEISKEIGVKAEEEGLKLIAMNSEGAMRDALSIFDKCVSSVDKTLTYDNVVECLGSLNRKKTLEFIEDILIKDINKIITSLREITNTNKSLTIIVKDITKHFRDILIGMLDQDSINNLEIDTEYLDKIKTKTYNISIERILDIIEKLIIIEEQMKKSSQPKIIFEVGIIELLESSKREELLERVINLENKLANINLEKSENLGKETKVEKKEEETFIEVKSTKNIYVRWNEFLDFVKKKKIALYALLVEGIVNKDYDEILVIEYKEGFAFHKDAISKENNIESLEKLVSEYFSTKLDIEIRMYRENFKKTDKKNEVEKAIDLFGEKNIIIE